jgi:PAS domain S-box-containing protein
MNALRGLVVALAIVAVLNNIATIIVMTIASQRSVLSVIASLRPIMLTGWVGSWIVNLLIGLLFVLGSRGHPVAVVLFPVPLLVLHYAYRGYATARADRMRLSGSAPCGHRPDRAAAPAQRDRRLPVRGRQQLRGAGGGARPAHRGLPVRDAPGRPAARRAGRAATRGQPARGRAGDAGGPRTRAGPRGVRAGGLVKDEGWRDCTCAPLVDEQRQLGALIVFDQTVVETGTADLAVLEALARETAHTLARGRLLESVMEERRKLDQIVSTTSDGIFTLSEKGEVLTWNTACERMTGLIASDVLGRRDTLYRLEARTAPGAPVDFGGWRLGGELPRDIFITTIDGSARRLSVAASEATDADGRTRTLVVVARDVTAADEYEELSRQFSEMAERQHAQRIVVDHLQQAVAPTAPELEGTDMAVTYVASDPSSPTGGDLYDWHLLPNGELHVAVVDVLGHGVAATKDALTVIHTLRLVAVEGTALIDVVKRADELLSAQDSELVATVVVARYNPLTGALRVVSGGHPPALVVGADGSVTQLAGTGGAIGWPAVGSDNVITTHLACTSRSCSTPTASSRRARTSWRAWTHWCATPAT